jgi:predicted transcriptional regulator of viral defense system
LPPTATGPVPAPLPPQSAHQSVDRSERALRALARGQHGVLTTEQIASVGLGPRAVRGRSAAGRLLRVHRGVYAVDPPDAHGRWMAAVLACGGAAVLSHRSAAALWGFCEDRGDVDVMAPTRAGR